MKDIKTNANRRKLLPKTNTNKRDKTNYDRKLRNADVAPWHFIAHGNVCKSNVKLFTPPKMYPQVFKTSEFSSVAR